MKYDCFFFYKQAPNCFMYFYKYIDNSIIFYKYWYIINFFFLLVIDKVITIIYAGCRACCIYI